jgi:hypothetical protein
MSIPVLMPALSPTMTEGTLAKWHVAVGDVVKSGQILADIETDKATMEVEAVDEGIVGALLIPAGSEGVAVNTRIPIHPRKNRFIKPSPPPRPFGGTIICTCRPCHSLCSSVLIRKSCCLSLGASLGQRKRY